MFTGIGIGGHLAQLSGEVKKGLYSVVHLVEGPVFLSHSCTERKGGWALRQITGRFLCRSVPQCWAFGGGTELTVLDQPTVAPIINVFPPTQEELATNRATLVCLLSGFYPRTVEVAWTKDGSPVSQGVETTPPFRQSDNKYSASSYLSVSADQWLSASTFTCKVTQDGKVIQKEISSSQST